MPRYSLFAIVLSLLLSSVCSGQDTTVSLNTGTIRVSKPKISPYITIRYDYSILEEKKKGMKESPIRPVAAFDTSGSYRVLKPHIRMSDFLVKKIDYHYPLADTPRIDSLRTVLLITSAGKLKKVYLAEDAGETDRKLADQFVNLMNGYLEWEKEHKTFEPGGLIRRKAWFRNEKFYPKDFNVEATVRFASYPQTPDQAKTGRRYDVNE